MAVVASSETILVAGSYTVRLRVHPRYVNENCTACGACTEAVERGFPKEYNYGMDTRKGAYRFTVSP